MENGRFSQGIGQNERMRKRFRIIVVILVVAGLGLVAWLSLRAHEPSYKGKPLTYWIDPPASGGHESATERAAALAAMRDRAVPYLVGRLRWKPSPTVQGLYNKYPNFPLFIAYQQGQWDPRGQAAHDLGEFGPMASNAIPELTAASSTRDLNSSWYVELCAKAALIKIRQESLAPYIDQLTNTSVSNSLGIENWYQNALIIGEMGTNAAAAVPNLILALGTTNNEVIQAHALVALGEIRSRPEVCIPAMVPFLRSPDVALRQKAVTALGEFGEAAKPAWAELTRCLGDSNPWTRQAAASVLKSIDPVAAAKAVQETR
jgi:HEAT repeat protein